MADNGDNLKAPMEHSSPPKTNYSGTRRHRRLEQHSRKRLKVVSSEIETHCRVQTLKPDSIPKFSSYACSRTNSCVQREDISRGRWLRTHCQRNWTYSAHDVAKYNDRVIIVSYNILGVENATKHPELYRGVSPKHLDWEYRKKLLCREIKGYKASILCFQEVDHFDDLNKILRKDGFRGLNKARAGESHDGCAIFWKKKLFTLLHEENIDFQRFGLRNNVAQFCVLKMNQDLVSADATSRTQCSAPRSLVVGNIHVLYNPKRGDIKLGQMRMFLEKTYELSQKWGCIPVVLTGDLNSLPQSAMYQFLASSKLHIQRHDRRHISGQIFPHKYAEPQSWRNHLSSWTNEEIVLATGSRDGCLRHPLELRSAYTEVPGSHKVRDKTGEPLVTSYHSLFSGTVDYIWHTLDLVPMKVLEALPLDSLRKIGGLPSKDTYGARLVNQLTYLFSKQRTDGMVFFVLERCCFSIKEWGSDHLAVACELAFADEG